MHLAHIKLKNWRNFREAEVDLAQIAYLIGPNASGKSNLLDAFRFLRDVAKPRGGGLQKAVEERGGITRLRCLHARRDTEVRIEVAFKEHAESKTPIWRYVLGFNQTGKGSLQVSEETVWKGEECLLSRPTKEDNDDLKLLTETHLEQIRANSQFRELAEFFSSITYLHLIPQLLKYEDQIGGKRLEDDPFGQSFLERIAQCPTKTRDARLRRIGKALQAAVPQFKELRFVKDETTGRPHLEALYEHHRPHGSWQREEYFSDGTLRLLGILWSLLEKEAPLLLEEPELSLHEEVIRQIPVLLGRIQRASKNKRQLIISTHSTALLSNPGIEGHSVVVLEPSAEGTKARPINATEKLGLDAGLSVADVVLPQTKPSGANQLGLFE